MPDAANCKCCSEIEELRKKLEEIGDPTIGCFTNHPWFEATCLNPGTLQTAYFSYRQQYGARALEGDRAKYDYFHFQVFDKVCVCIFLTLKFPDIVHVFLISSVRKFRHVAYRQVVRWCWGYLGKHNRVPLPSCVMKEIRRAYPDPDGDYKGFKYPPLDEL